MTTPRFAPLPEGTTVTTAIAELEQIESQPLWAMLQELYEATGDANSETHISVWLDWATQLRMGGMNWADAINAARIFYYG